jgi:putative oxidoreductase
MYELDLGLLLVRVVIGVLMFAHGTQKLFAWFKGFGIEGTAGFFGSIGYRSGTTMAVIAGVTEAALGISLTLGLFVPAAAAALVGVMINVAVAGHGRNGFWNHNPQAGWEFPMVLGTIGAAIGLTGPGDYSLDSYLGLEIGFTGAGVVAVAVGVIVGALFLALFREPVQRGSEEWAMEEDRAA